MSVEASRIGRSSVIRHCPDWREHVVGTSPRQGRSAARSTLLRPSPAIASPIARKGHHFPQRIVGWLDAHPLTAQQVFQRLRDAGYEGGISIVKDYVHKIRPPRREAFLTLLGKKGTQQRIENMLKTGKPLRN